MGIRRSIFVFALLLLLTQSVWTQEQMEESTPPPAPSTSAPVVAPTPKKVDSKKLKKVSPNNYTRLLDYSGGTNGIALGPQLLPYDFKQKDTLQIGKAVVGVTEYKLLLGEQGSKVKFRMNWPATLVTDVDIRFYNEKDDVLVTEKFDKEKVKIVVKVAKNKDNYSKAGSFEDFDFNRDWFDQLTQSNKFYVCAEKNEEKFKARFCSPYLRIDKKAKKAMALKEEHPQKVVIDGEDVTNFGLAYLNKGLNEDNVIKFKAVYENGAFFEIETGPQNMEIIDVSRFDDGESLRIKMKGGNPSEREEDFGKPWISRVSKKSMSTPVHGRGGGSSCSGVSTEF